MAENGKLKIAWIDIGMGIGNSYGYSTHARNMKKHTAAIADLTPDADIAVQIQTADKFQKIPDKKNFLFTMYEAEEIPATFAKGINEADHIIVPCEHNKRVFRPYTDKPISVCHEGCNVDLYTFAERKVERNKPFRFLWVGAPNPRKGWEEVVAAWHYIEGKKQPGIELYLKTTMGDLFEKKWNVTYDSRNMSLKELIALYHSAHCFLFPCFHPDTEVMTPNGSKIIADILIGQEVLGQDGTFCNVTDKHVYYYNREIFEIKPYYLPSFQVTPRHRFPVLCKPKDKYWKQKYQEEPEKYINWVEAQDIRKGDFLLMPRMKKIEDKESLPFDNTFHKRWLNRNGKAINDVTVDYDLMWLFGLWLAEGCIHIRHKKDGLLKYEGIVFSISSTEHELTDKIINILKSKFGVDCIVSDLGRNRRNVTVWSMVICKQFYELFANNRAKGKKMPEWFLTLPHNKQMGLIRGMWDGDGNAYLPSGNGYKAMKDTHVLSYSTVSRELARQLSLILTRLGIRHTFKKRVKNKHNDEYKIISRDNKLRQHFGINGAEKEFSYGWFDDDYFYVPIQKVKQQEYIGKVIDLSVNKETFSIGVVTHNSRGEGWGLTCCEAMATGLPTVATEYSGTADFFDSYVGYPIKYDLRRFYHAQYELQTHAAAPSVEDLAEQMLYVYTHYTEARVKGRKAAQRIRHKFTWQKAAEKLVGILRDNS